MLRQTMVLALGLLMSWDNDDEAVQNFIASSDK